MRRERTRAGRDGAAATSVPLPRPPCAALHAGRRCALCACNACEGADLRAPNARVRVRLEREREAPHRSARLCDPRARTRSACDTNSRLVYATASELAWPGNWGRRSVAIGEGRGRGTAARARNRPFSAPHARNGVGIGSGVRVCAKCCCLAVPMSWLACRLVTPWPPRHSAVETRGCGASHMGARRPPYPARVGENWQANPQLTTTGPFRPSVDRRRDLHGGR